MKRAREPWRRLSQSPGVPSSWLIESASVPAYGDKIERPDGSQCQMVGSPGLPAPTVWRQIVAGAYDTGMELLIESANELDMASGACESSEDAARLFALADRIKSYLAMSRPTTTLGMPRIVSDDARLTDEDVIHRTGDFDRSHIRILSD